MLFVVFVLLFGTCLALWTAGAPAALVFGLALGAWIVFGLVLLPRIRTYKSAMGLDDALRAAEARGCRWLGLRIAGLKVVALAFLSSTLPFLAQAMTWLSGQNVSIFFGPDAAQRVAFYLAAGVFALPFLMSWLHVGAIKDAALTEPKA